MPPIVEPDTGVTPVTAGAGKLYVNAFDSVPLCPLGLVTVTLTLPAVPGGVVAVIVVLLTTVTPVALLPKFTVACDKIGSANRDCRAAGRGAGCGCHADHGG